MKYQDVVRRLQTYLPYYTGYFSEELDVTSLSSVSNVITCVTSTAHGLTTNDYVFISGALVPIPITTLTFDDNQGQIVYDAINGILVNGIYQFMNRALSGNTVENLGTKVAFATTSVDHDLSMGWQTQVQVSGADQDEYNGTHYLLQVSNRENFVYLMSDDADTPATGDITFLQDLIYGFNGWVKVTVVDDYTFTYEATGDIPDVTAAGDIILRTIPRISGALTIETAVLAYTKHSINKIWGFVVMENDVASKDRGTPNDAIMQARSGSNYYRQLMIQGFTFYVFVPTTYKNVTGQEQKYSGGIEARDFIQDLTPAICKTLLRSKFPTGFSEISSDPLVIDQHGAYEYQEAFYIHKFTFQSTYYLNITDAFDRLDTRAFRDVYYDFNNLLENYNSGKTEMTAHVDLDDEPLT